MRVVRGLWGSTHPGPTLVVTALAGALGVAVALEPWRLALLIAAVFAGQVSVGLSNDALDAARDRAVGRTDKPIARGDVTLPVAWVAASVALAAALALSAPLGWRMLAAHALALGSAWAYNAGVKATAWSIVPFAVSFGVFPSLATLSGPDAAYAAPWVWFAGATLGAAVHLVNVLPDLADDAATGIRGLPHRIGPRASAVAAALALVAGAAAVLVGSGAGALSWVFFTAVAALAVVVAVRPPTRALFRLAMLAALVLAAQLVASGSALTG